MLTAQRKTTAAAQRSKASVPQPAAVLPHKPRGAVVANANLGDAAKGMTSAALAAALLLGGAPQPAHAEFNKQAVENVNRSGAEVSKTIQENTPDLPSITGGAVNKAINKVKDTLSYDDNTRGLKQAGEKFTNVLKGGDASSDAKSEQRVSQKSELLDRGVSALPAPSPIADLAVGKQDYSNDYSAALRQEGINAKRGDGLTGAFFNKANNGKIDITKGTYDSVEDAGRDAKANLQRVGDKANDSLGGLKRAADKAADKAKDLVSQAPTGWTYLGDIADAGQDLKNAGRKAADNIGAAGAAAKDYSAELRRVGIEAKRGDGLTGAFRKANNGKIDITKGTYNSIEDAASDAQRGLDRAGSAAQRGLDRATNKAGDVLNVKSNPIDSVKRAADKAADKAKDLVSQAPTGWTYLGDIADAGDNIQKADRKTRNTLVGGANDDRSAELRRVGIEAKRGAGLTGAFRNANQGYQSLPEGDADRVLTGGIKDAAKQGQRGLERATEKANVLQNVTDSNPVDSVKRAAGKAADKAKDLVSQAPTGYTVLGDLAEYSGKREDQGPLRPSLPGPSNRSSDGTVTGNSAQSTSDLTQDAKSGFIPTLQKLGGNIKNLTTGPETTTTDALEPVGRAPQLQREVGQGRPRSDLSANELRNDATRNAANNN